MGKLAGEARHRKPNPGHRFRLPVDVAATPATVEEEDSLATEEDELSPSLIPSSQEPSDYDQMRQRNIDEIEAKKATVFAGETFGGLAQKGKKAKKNKAK